MTRGRVDWCRLGLLAASMLALAVAGCTSHKSHAGTVLPHTVTKTFHAYDSTGELTVQVDDVATGKCWTASIAAHANGAYRCIADNQIFDPCFAAPKPTTPLEVACVSAPWGRAEVLRLTAPLPTVGPPAGSARPWAIKLANGARCVASTGTVPQVNGVNLGYHCTNGGDAGLRAGAPSALKADYGEAATNRLQVVRVTTIWRA